jgi:serine/threonine protein kinase
MQAIDLAVKQTPMNIPAISIQKPSAQTKQRDIELRARRPSENTLIDENGSVYHLQPVIIAGTFGAVRIGIKQDPVVAQRFMFKEMARALGTYIVPLNGRTNQDTMFLRPSDDDILRAEVEMMLKVDSPLAPQILLKTAARYFLGMPPLEGDLLDAASYIAHVHPKLLPVLSRILVRDVAQMLVKLDDKDVSHRDIKLENILYASDGHMFLADYGLSENQTDVRGLSGTPLFFAPEAFRAMVMNWQTISFEQKTYNGKKADIYALGMASLLALINTPHTPFDLSCYYDSSLSPELMRRAHPAMSYVEIVRHVFSTLQDVNRSMADFEQSAQMYRSFLSSSDDAFFPSTPHPRFDTYFFQAWRQDSALLEVILSMLHTDPRQRPTAAQIVAKMQAPNLVVTKSQQKSLAAALAQRSSPAPSTTSTETSAASSTSSRIVSRNNTVL